MILPPLGFLVTYLLGYRSLIAGYSEVMGIELWGRKVVSREGFIKEGSTKMTKMILNVPFLSNHGHGQGSQSVLES